jgi:hypothetical protein
MARNDSAPLLWRMRHSIGRVWFAIAIGMVGLGAFTVLYAIFAGPLETAGLGLTLIVGGALLAVGFRRKPGRR